MACAPAQSSVINEELRIQCGTVYTWNCAGELYAIECALCEERPLCTLSEFAEHMDIWHSNWNAQEEQVGMVMGREKEREVEVEGKRNTVAYIDEETIDDVQNELLQEVLAELRATGEFYEEPEELQPLEQLLEKSTDGMPQPFEKVFLDTDKQVDVQINVNDSKERPQEQREKKEREQLPNKVLKLASIQVENEQLLEGDKLQNVETSTMDGLPNGKYYSPVNTFSKDYEQIEAVKKVVAINVTNSTTELNSVNYIQDNDTSVKKLSTQHVEKLIELYKAQPRLWNQTHEEFRDTELCRHSWQEITAAWNAHCGRNFTIAEVRIRVSTLCQRFMKQRERLEAEGELDECSKFVHYDHLTFLVEQQTLQHRRAHFERENRKLLEIYQHYPVLWHTAHRNARCPEQREQAYRSISQALKLSGINMSAYGVQRRVQSLRKFYRLEKIRYLHCMVEGKQLFRETLESSEKMEQEFVSDFKHWYDMEFLHNHIDPYVCAACGKIFENLVSHREHINNWTQGCWKVYELENDQYDIKNATNSMAIVDDFPPKIMSTQNDGETQEANANTDMYGNEMEIQQAQIVEQQQHNNNAQPNELVVNVQCAQFTYNLHLDANETYRSDQTQDATTIHKKLKISNTPQQQQHQQQQRLPKSKHTDRLSVSLTHELIALYKAQPALWDPNHLDYHTRQQRRLAWNMLTTQLNRKCKKRYTWQMLHRKLTDYTKYYRKEKQRINAEAGACTKWCFFNDFRFLDDVLDINMELQKSMQQRDNNLKVIEMYKAHPQLWCTDHPDYTKRKQRQRHTESMCTRLQEEYNLHITPERLKTRLIELRYQYRQVKEQRLQALKRNETWTSNYDYYEVLKFLDQHVSPFVCTVCSATFKRRTDYLQHERKVHDGRLIDNREQDNAETAHNNYQPKSIENSIEHICHVCGMKFSMRNNLLAHLRRHMGQRNHLCTICPKKFFNTTALRVHVRSHTKELPYVCEHCARGFVNASKLNQHVKRHRNQRDFPCSRCDKAFFTAFERDRHLRAHLNIRDKVCPICSRAFVVGSAYYAHMNLHRDSKRYCCDNCGLRFAQYAGLYKHRKRCNASELINR